MKKYNNWLSFTFYSKTGKVWYCEYIGSIDNKFIKGKSIAGGYGYDKESTCLSKSINKFNNHWVRYSKKSKNILVMDYMMIILFHMVLVLVLLLNV